MVAKLLVLYGPPKDAEAFETYYERTHAPLAKAVPGLRSFTTNAGPVMTPAGPAEDVYRVSTLVWDTVEDLQPLVSQYREGLSDVITLTTADRRGLTAPPRWLE